MNTYFGIDFGSRYIKGILGQPKKNSFHILGTGLCSSYTVFEKGTILDIFKAKDTIENLLHQVSKNTDVTEIKNIYVSFSSPDIRIEEREASIHITEDGGLITDLTVNEVIKSALAVNIRNDEEILHVIIQNFKIDNSNYVLNPLDMSGNVLSAKIIIILAKKLLINNIKKSVEKVGLELSDILLESISSSFSTLKEQEREEGVIHINLGANCCDVLFIKNNTVKNIYSLNFGGSCLLAKDIVFYYKTKLEEAEKIIEEHGDALISNSRDKIKISHSDGGFIEIEKTKLDEIIEARLRELLSVINQFLTDIKAYDEYNNSGIVFTGAIADLKNFSEYASSIFNSHVRVGKPFDIVDPLNDKQYSFNKYSAAAGTLIYGYRRDNNLLNNLFYSYKDIEDLKKGKILHKVPKKEVVKEKLPIEKEKKKYLKNIEEKDSKSVFEKIKEWYVNIKKDFE